MAIQNIMELDRLNVKRSMPIPPFDDLGLIPAGNALRRMKHFIYPEGKAAATRLLADWANNASLLEGKVYLDSLRTTVIVTGFFLAPLMLRLGKGNPSVGEYPYLDSPCNTLFSIILHNLNDLINPSTPSISKPTWQETDVTTNLDELTLRRADKEDFAKMRTPLERSGCSSQRKATSHPCPSPVLNAVYDPPIQLAWGVGQL